MDCSRPGSSVRGIFQARVLEWVAIAFSKIIIITIPWWFSSKKNPPSMREVQFRSLGQEDRLEKENGNPLQYSCLGHLIDKGTWLATVHGVTKSQAGLSD